MKPPQTKFTKLGDDSIAYQVLGDGPIDLLLVPANGEGIDFCWEWPPYAAYLSRLASFSRLIMFDRRGTGASDPITEQRSAPWEHWADDARAVLDVAGSESASLFGVLDSGPIAILFAAVEPERTRSLILYTTTAKLMADTDYDVGNSSESFEAAWRFTEGMWGTEKFIGLHVPSMRDNEAFCAWLAKTNRNTLSPHQMSEYIQASFNRLDVRAILPSITVPTLVMQREKTVWFTLEQGKYVADHIKNSTFVAIPGADTPPHVAPTEEILTSVQRFLTGAAPAAEASRALAAVLFTDIVASTERAVALGDQRWRGLLESHDVVARALVEEFRGRFVKHTGDGVLATFDGPGRAIRCVAALREALRPLGIEIRAGMHTGEVELMGEDIGGLGVHVAARVLEHAQAGELLVSGAVPMLVAGSGIEFVDKGIHELKGVPGEWRLFAVKS